MTDKERELFNKKRSEYGKTYRVKNKEKLKVYDAARKKIYRAKNKEKIYAYEKARSKLPHVKLLFAIASKKHRLKPGVKERYRANSKRWRNLPGNKDRMLELKRSEKYKAKRRETRNKEQSRAQCASYYQKNKEKEKLRRKKYDSIPENAAHKKEYRKTYDKGWGGILRYKKRQELDSNYIRNMLTSDTNLKYKDISQNLVDFKRTQLLIYRELQKSLKNKHF